MARCENHELRFHPVELQIGVRYAYWQCDECLEEATAEELDEMEAV